MGKLKRLQKYIRSLEKQSFYGWDHKDMRGYLTACKSIKEEVKTLRNDKSEFDTLEEQMKYEHFDNVSGKYTLDQIEKLLP